MDEDSERATVHASEGGDFVVEAATNRRFTRVRENVLGETGTGTVFT
jgi:hypothetical protein